MQEYEINLNLPESEVSLLMYSDSHHFQRMREIKRGGYLLEIFYFVIYGIIITLLFMRIFLEFFEENLKLNKEEI